MNAIPGYTLHELIYQSEKKSIYRAVRKADGRSLIIKALTGNKITTSDTAKLMHEYEVTKHLNIAGIVKPLYQEQTGGTVVLVMEDNGGLSLKTYLQRNRPALPFFFPIAMQLCQTLMELHRHGVIHKDLKPDNIIINERTGQVCIIDFSHSTRLLGESHKSAPTHSFAGSLPYMSPEQTGRMNRAIDFRGDLYSLGVIFYEMLTGQLPLYAETKMDWVHAHIAKKPIPPHHRMPELPRIISEVIMKLLAKTPEERYQSAYGLLCDLANCREQYEAKGDVSVFPLGQMDELSQFQIPSTLYGRAEEVIRLRDAYKRTRTGATELTLISGYSGVGKTELAFEAYRPAVAERGYFIVGKFDQLQQEIPYVPLIQAFQDLVRQILTEPAEKIADWKKKLLRALGRAGSVVTEVIPEVKLIIGEQPPVEELPPAEAQNRFQLIFRKFVQVFSSRNHPLIIFLDDLHWADQASLDFLRLLITDPGSRYLLLTGAYRENEVGEQHPLMKSIAGLQAKGIATSQIQLHPLAFDHTLKLIAETLHCEKERARPLAEAVYRKTAGNPFYFKQLLQAMHKDELLYFCTDSARWEWSLGEIEKKQSFADVITLMIEKIERLPEDTRNALRLAGCMGNSFDLKTLSLAAGESLSETARRLLPAITAGLLLPMDDSYSYLYEDHGEAARTIEDDFNVSFAFLHDRVQQTAYSLISDEEKKEIHLLIGRMMLETADSRQLDEKIYQIVHHLNIGRDRIASEEEKKRLAELNLQAGQKAKGSTAYFSALNHFRSGLGLLSELAWQDHYELAFQLHLRRAECEYLCSHYEAAEEQFVQLMLRARDKIDRVEVYRIRIALYINLGKYVEAIQLGLQGLEEFDVSIAYEPKLVTIVRESLVTRWKLSKRMDALVDLPYVSDPTVKAIMELIMAIAAPAFFVNKEAYVVLMCRYIRLALASGNTEASSAAYALFGLVLSLGMGHYKEGDRMGEIALQVMEKYPNATFKCRTFVTAGGVLSQWVRHPRESEQYLAKALQLGLESGDFIFASYAMGTHVNGYYAWGSLPGLAEIVGKYLAVLKQLNEEFVRKNFYVYLQVVRNLQGKTHHRFTLTDDQFDEDQFLQDIQSEETQVTTFYQYYTYKTQIHFLFGHYQEAIGFAEKAREYLKYSTHLLHVPELVFYQSLAIAAECQSFSPPARSKHLKVLRKNIRQMKKWAESCPDNFLHKYLLMEAERARIDGRDQAAMDLYDQAIQSAKEQQYVRNEAIACELAAAFYLSRKKERFAGTYLTQSLQAFHQWGATEKVKQLRETYPQLQQEQLTESPEEPLRSQNELGPFFSSTTTKTGSSPEMDLETFLQAMQEFSKETDLPKLLDSYLDTAIKSAGAEKGFVLLEKDGELCVEAGKQANELVESIKKAAPLDEFENIPAAIIHYVARTRESVVLSDASRSGIFERDAYVKQHRPRSILCIPILYLGVLVGVLYLENNLTTDAFHADRMEFLEMLSSQMASAKLLRSSGSGTGGKKETAAVQVYYEPLTDREQEILQLIANGLSNQEIAEQLILSVGTVKSYIVHLYGKLQVNRRVQAVSKAKELGLLK
ncbi:helix-turn-helix transcriptional regulator [Brevibacillus choshinensis]|uniref:AAA family ATPase n=1 Tax=Brevibacillus choshinensis TaxID=54911 RepID=A0ABX7FMP8_BRECH|nr:AAA family ATPase [Brevibacillus choshinensis]QRG67513.1 AAA family ATPase [Brevibacillus choshinensis]